MPFCLKISFFLRLFPILICGLALSTPAHAQSSDDRCAGTLCDFYYGSRPATPAPSTAGVPAGATQLAVPSIGNLFSSGSTPTPSTDGTVPAPAGPLSRVQIGGGGLAGRLNGTPDERCSGTICDFYYGGSKPESAQAPTAAAVQPETPAPDIDPAPSSQRREGAGVKFAKPNCVAPAGDPWRCYR